MDVRVQPMIPDEVRFMSTSQSRDYSSLTKLMGETTKCAG